MFGAKHTTEPESDSDWDSISGDAVPAPSSPEQTPRFQPTPPASSPRTAPFVNNKHGSKLPSVTNPVLERTSAHNSPLLSPTSHKPSQLYGKPGITSFTDRNLEQRPHREASGVADMNGYRPQKTNKAAAPGRKHEVAVEMNDMQYQANDPPYTDFQDSSNYHFISPESLNYQKSPFLAFTASLTPGDNNKTGKASRPRKAKVKAPYLASQNNNTEEGEGSWDDSDRENQFSSQQQLTQPNKALKNQSNHVTKRPKDSSSYHNAVPQHNDSNAKDSAVIPINESDVESHTLSNNCCAIVKPAEPVGYKYYFDHGHTKHLDVNPEWRDAHMKRLADHSEKWLKYFWQEFFGVVRLIFDFFLIFVLELMAFVVRHILVRSLVGLVVVVGDHLLKPLLTALFNSFVQPLLAFLWNVLVGCKNAVQPVLDLTREILLQVATLLKAFRLFELNWKPNLESQHQLNELQIM